MYTLQDKICILLGELEITSSKYFQLLELFDDAQQLVDGVASNSAAKKILGANHADVCKGVKTREWENIITQMQQHGVVAITCHNDKYPTALEQIDDMPYVLFCKGNVDLLKSDCLAVIGTRKVSSYGRRVAKDFVAILSEHFTIVSGLAYGVDSIAHEATLAANGKTVAVLGSGILRVYPSSNEHLAQSIVANGGLIVSEYGLHGQPVNYHFPQRNRIVSGLSRGVLVCQAPAKSGTNSTVELALEQGKDVFVVPGEIYDLGFSGSNSLIKSMQGACVTTPRDIEDFYQLNEKSVIQKQTVQLNFEEQAVVDALLQGKASFDALVMQTGIAPPQLIILLANLELRSIIARLPGNFYRLYGGIE